MISRRRLENSLSEFIKEAWHVIEPTTLYLHNWHIDAMCEYLEAVSDGRINRLLINCPPRYMKSIVVSIMWPCWVWIKRPESRWIFTSYAQDLATEHSMKRRAILTSDWYQERWGNIVRLADDRNLKTEFANTRTGVMTATSIDGTATGKGGDFIVFDDPHNPKKAESEVERKGAVNNFRLTFSTRLNNKHTGAIVGVMQRLHVDDLAGHSLANGYEHLCLSNPAQALTLTLPDGKHREVPINVTLPSGKVIRRSEGELLWPEREGPEEIARVRKELGEYGFAGQYGQTPNPMGGGKFQRKWFRYFTQDSPVYRLHKPEGDENVWIQECTVFQTWDLALSEKETACWTVGATWALTPKYDLLLLDINRFRAEAPDVKAAIKTSRVRWNPMYQAIERAHFGTGICQEWIRSGYPIMELIADRDKITRSLPAGLAMENGKVYFLAGAEWLGDYESELMLFPNGAWDDQVDVTSYAGLILSGFSMGPSSGYVPLNDPGNMRRF